MTNKKLNILVVDDSASVRLMMRYILEGNSFAVQEAKDGQEALDLLKAQPEDLVITDLHMPRMNGMELIGEMKGREDLRHIPVIVLTTDSQQPRMDEARSRGAAAWIMKPFQPEKLLETVRKVLT